MSSIQEIERRFEQLNVGDRDTLKEILELISDADDQSKFQIQILYCILKIEQIARERELSLYIYSEDNYILETCEHMAMQVKRLYRKILARLNEEDADLYASTIPYLHLIYQSEIKSLL